MLHGIIQTTLFSTSHSGRGVGARQKHIATSFTKPIVLSPQRESIVQGAAMLCRETCAFPHCYSDWSYNVSEPHEHHRCLQHKPCLDLTSQTVAQGTAVLPSEEVMVCTQLPNDKAVSVPDEAMPDTESVALVNEVDSI